jgi:gliding motility-associated protein GldE
VDEPPSFVFSGSLLSLILGSISVCSLMLLSGLIAASETSVFALLPAVQRLKKSRSSQENLVASLLDDPLALRVSLVFLHVIVKVALTMLLLFLAWQSKQDSAIGIIIIVASLAIIICELVPRLYARKNDLSVSLLLVRPLKVLVNLMKPMVNPILRFRAQWKKSLREKDLSHDELAQVLELSSASTEAENEKEILRGIVNFGSLRVIDLMRPLDAMIAVSIDSTFTELVSFINSEGYSRMPVYRTDLNSIEGVLYIKDLLPFLDEPAEFAWSRMLRPGFFVTENKKIDLLLRDFQEKRVHMAIVKNELGQTSGIITLEDLIREIIGELNTDNSEIPESGFRKLDENIFVFDGRTPVQEFFRVLDQEHPFFREPGEEESLEDFIIEFNDELPEVGDELYYEQYTFVIEAVEQKRIKRVRVNVHAQA